ncbi:winged helix-turn-helix domain-containing protein [Pseudoalteromonas denitrificans]|uniref:DNA-binding winged helix-turn-helix (WHTH) domain-containing protein n=1 Tax=Pseudoalteromonas denitrificans DSM 6059 TaxID=1123010 RepID=A0A1I1JC63_9GAMM|nr:winged helix-turn-helix domain-containing protein [Pseudoalteromonas denitrificans]SFC46134.1 DNA-binding winged helix-turn-helix (wHTH) domain-containing protein [Pseudoalteromonas denitrificans DSM 6059]
MKNTQTDINQIQIGEFVFDKTNSTLILADKSTKLEPLSFSFLCFLIKNQGQVVSREELLNVVWENRVVSDDSIRKVVKKLRDAFNDDAKSPKYIKTVSLKGYCLVADIKVCKTKSKKTYKSIILIIAVVIVWISTFIIFTTQKNNEAVFSNNTKHKIELLTNLPGSEIDADFHQKTNTLIFSHKTHNDALWQLHYKNLNSGLTSRLTWDQHNYQKPLFSPKGNKIIFWRTNKPNRSLFMADFKPNTGLTNVVNLSAEFSTALPLSWSSNGELIYFAGTKKSNAPITLFTVNISSLKTKQLTFVNSAGFGDYFAKESNDGKKLAMLRNVADQKYVMLIIDLETGKIIVNKPISFYANAIVWHKNNEKLYISSYKGDFYYYSLIKDQLTKQAGTQPSINDVIHNCGDNCFYMRQHNMNYTDITEIPNPFEEPSNSTTLYIESDNAEFHPIYNAAADALYYTSKSTHKANIIHHVLGGDPKVLYSFAPQTVITDLSINQQENKLLGKAEGRIFILDLLTKKLSYKTSALEIAANPSWKLTGEGIYFSRIENRKQRLIQYDLKTSKVKKLNQDIIQKQELSDGRIFIIDSHKNLYQVMPDSTKKIVIKLPRTGINHWQIHKNDLYYSFSEGNDFYLTRLNMSTKQQNKHLITKNTLYMDFKLHPDGKKILFTKPIIDKSNIIKINW